MADWDSADLLSRFRRVTLTTSNTADTNDTAAYQLLSNAQRRICTILAAVAPNSQVSAQELLTTSDSGRTYALTYFPLSHLELYDGSENGVQIFPAAYSQNAYDGFVLDAQTIRWPGGITRTFGNGLYARYVRTPAAISGASAPSLQPPHARQAVVYDAASEWAHEGGVADPAPFDDQCNKILRGNPAVPGDIGIIGMLQTQARGQGLVSARQREGRWYKGNGWVGE